ncbi:MAG TPA: GNAT family N-acetyltransferase [Thermoleophilaceae bacterium]|nr:GNAT family N-acetyltransferase [Thermoleophilaceae bacterium]
MEISSVPQSAFDNALAFQRELDEALATRVEPTPYGTQLYRGDFVKVTDVNVLVVHKDVEVDAPTLIDEAERLQAFLPHRAIRVDDQVAAERLAPEFAGRGWIVSRTALMTLRRLPDRPMDTSGVAEVEIDRIRAAREASIRRVHRDLDVAAEALQVGALQNQYAPLRAYAALVGNEVAAYCLLRIREDGAKLVEVEALARSQGHGVGRAVIWAAASTARRERINPIFVECEHSDWAKTSYRRLGFDEAGMVHRFVRPW